MIIRDIYSEVKKHLEKKEITLITGPRQCGKTTLVNALKDELESKGNQTKYLNLDKEEDFQKLSSQQEFIKLLQLEFGKEEKVYVFIDEIQMKSDAGRFMKGIYDSNYNFKFIITGSGSIELKEKVSESLAGRKKAFTMETLSFREFINYKLNYRYTSNLDEYLKINNNLLVEEYLQFGGYPKVVLCGTLEEKIDEISEIYNSYLEKDITKLLNVKKTTAFDNLLAYMSATIGNIVNYSSISNDLGVDDDTTKKYLYYLEKTFILSKVAPFYTNVISETTKSPNFYFKDLGMRNFIYNRFTRFNLLTDGGSLFENFIHRLLIDIINIKAYKINFWRTKDGAEVDFIVSAGNIHIPIEVKYKKLEKPQVQRSLKNYILKYAPPNAYVVNQNYEDTITIEKTKVHFIPYYKMLNPSFNLLN